MPPSTAAVNAISPSWKPASQRVVVVNCAYMTPAAPAITPPSAKVNAIVRLTSMPISRGGVGVLRGRAHRLALPGVLARLGQQRAAAGS